jgi:DtxR family transcriptional regulator, Mn-dependent transcriptional regulator
MESIAGNGQEEVSRQPLSEAQEDYLKQIFLLGEGRGRVTTQAIAGRLGVRPASVTEMVGRLAQLDLVEHAPYRGVHLTEAGRRVALEMLRHHRLLETFLVEVLGYRWDQVHEEAERLEHVISERFEARIAEAMGHPTRDPHGDPIPSRELNLPSGGSSMPLRELASGMRAILVRVGAQDPDSLNLLERLGLAPGDRVEVIESDDKGVRVQIGEDRLLLPNDLAEMLLMERLEA